MPKDVAARVEKLRETLRHHERLYYVLDQPTIRAARSGADCGPDVLPAKKRWWLRLHEKNGKLNEMPCHHNREEYLDGHIEAAGIGRDRKGRCSWRQAERQRHFRKAQCRVWMSGG